MEAAGVEPVWVRADQIAGVLTAATDLGGVGRQVWAGVWSPQAGDARFGGGCAPAWTPEDGCRRRPEREAKGLRSVDHRAGTTLAY